MTGVSKKRGNLETDMYTGRTLCDDWSYAAKAKECQRLPTNHQS